MQIAGAVDLVEVLKDLARLRPVFHSEADFQLALAWRIQQADPRMRVRLETGPAPGRHLDLECARPDLGQVTAIELKYLTRAWAGVVGGERYELKNHGAQDVRGYDVVKDVERVEQCVRDGISTDGVVVALANDASYWRPAKADDATNAAAFRLGEGVVLEGRRSWGPRTGAGTLRARERPLDIHGRYDLSWRNYSTLPDGGPASRFRQLVIPILPDRPTA